MLHTAEVNVRDVGGLHLALATGLIAVAAALSKPFVDLWIVGARDDASEAFTSQYRCDVGARRRKPVLGSSL